MKQREPKAKTMAWRYPLCMKKACLQFQSSDEGGTNVTKKSYNDSQTINYGRYSPYQSRFTSEETG